MMQRLSMRWYQIASGAFLTSEVPLEWEEMDLEEQKEFVDDHTWGPLTEFPSIEILKMIDDHYERIINAVRTREER